MRLVRQFLLALVGLAGMGVASLSAWDYEGHRVVNQLALATLPTNFPAFALTPEARERIAFLGGEADRWRNITDDLALAHCNGPDHYLDIEHLADFGFTPATAPIFRYELVAAIARERAAHPEKFEPIDPAKNQDRTRELIGFAPWAITEYQGKLRSGFSYLKALQDYSGTAAEIANAQANIVYVMGVMGHFVGDCAQPLHTTKHHNGWVGANPDGYTTNRYFHSWIDGGFYKAVGGAQADPLRGRLRPARIVGNPFQSGDILRQTMNYLVESHQLVEPLYRLERDGKLRPEQAGASEGRAFLDTQLLRGGQMLGDLWYSAWQQATEDKYLIRQLKERVDAGKQLPSNN
jgi:hypothetical protein